MSTVFGPVRSRRFGVSLGVDLSASSKQCNFDCLYCELAPMRAMAHQHTVASVETIMRDLSQALKNHPNIDVITLTANGEPTMYPHLSELIERINSVKGTVQTLILSNSACLSDRNVFDALMKLDSVKLSLDAVTPEIFRKIDRPAEGIDIHQIIEAIRDFSHCYSGKLFIEILFVKGINDTLEEVAALNEVLLGISCERIDIGTIDRPPAYSVEGLNFCELFALSHRFDPSLPIHIVSRTHATAVASYYSPEDILTTLEKRPLTQEDIEVLFDDASKRELNKLLEMGKVTTIERSNVIFLTPAGNIHRKRSK